jgi:hypothetical protein
MRLSLPWKIKLSEVAPRTGGMPLLWFVLVKHVEMPERQTNQFGGGCGLNLDMHYKGE